MYLDIFNDLSTIVTDLFDKLKKIVDQNADNPLFWVLLVVIMLAITYYVIHALNND